MLYFAHQLAEELGEIDPYRVLSLPASTLLGWQAYFSLKAEQTGTTDIPQAPPSVPETPLDQQCADVMKIIGG
ncbi:hypothetical protein K6U37_13390 [Vibrio parahaemolyticus]|uniref:hypothetical protein n=1 Tax=Vibrio parahaemolyticus TaxID=670 RepID=UPI001EEB5F40|nr:hypothetical protein [Vibrio parahaemolyticus]MCG6489943.1 hypothetical protein [Vibrio parahaemolyticus]